MLGAEAAVGHAGVVASSGAALGKREGWVRAVGREMEEMNFGFPSLSPCSLAHSSS